MYEYVKKFENLGMGMFVHFGLYSVIGKGEWAYTRTNIKKEKYQSLINKFNVKKGWAKNLVSTAKNAGCKYIVLTARHHDGFSLFDTMGLNEYDAPHSKTGRDLVGEFVEECNRQGIVPFLYHTLLDWYSEDYKNDFPKYIDYLIKSVGILCSRYGKIGGLWFDGYWDNPQADWQFDRLYAMIRKCQPQAMIINNTGLENMGSIVHPEIDSVTFERGKPRKLIAATRPVAGEMCQTLNDHWGYAKNDISYKSVASLINDLVTCRSFNCNFLLNVGPMGNGDLRLIDKAILGELGKWIKLNKGFIYNVHSSEITAENAIILEGDNGEIYAVTEAPMVLNLEHASLGGKLKTVKINSDVKSARWLDNGKAIKISHNSYQTTPFAYGTSLIYRVAKIHLNNKQ